MRFRTTATAAAVLNLLLIVASIVVNKLTGFSRWPAILIGAALLCVLTAGVCALAWWIEHDRSPHRNHTVVRITAAGRSRIAGSEVRARNGAEVDLRAASSSRLRRIVVDVADADVGLRASRDSRITDQNVEADS